MLNDIRSISKSFFNKENPQELDTGEIEAMITRYPYFAPLRFLLAEKLHSANAEDSTALVTAGLYIHNPLRLSWLLSRKPENADAGEPDTGRPVEEKQEVQSSDEAPIVFQSYHTIDYFASQGIRLQQAELTKDKLGQQLKSFTEWLRSMKKLPSESDAQRVPDDQNRHNHVIQSAAHSIESKEILTEAMAEVWAKQGNAERAIAIYDKLSLQNPGKSGYFAAKIDQLKAL